MCLITFAWQMNADYPLILAGNRDEFYQRAATPARFWPEAPWLLAGRDLSAGGTWLGVTRHGRFAALTNYRQPALDQASSSTLRSRGLLVGDYLQGDADPMAYAEAIEGERYGGFSLLLGDVHNLVVFSNRGMAPTQLAPGVYGLSNHLLNTPWPKVEKARAGMQVQLAKPDTEQLLTLLSNEEVATDDQLPNTGIEKSMEKMLSSLFIRSPIYGTRVSTVLMIGKNRIEFVEQTFDKGELGERSSFIFYL